ncbi:14099_t:CDS:2, partial [Dentiscutata heterogama]
LKELRKAINYLVLMLPSELKWRDQLDSKYLNSNYPTFNLIYPTMKLFIKKFAPSNSQAEDDYTNLLFEPRKQISDQSQFIADNKNSSESDIEYKYKAPKPPVTSVELHNLVKAVSYFSLQEYWEVPDEIGLIVSFLDLQIKNLKFIDDEKIKITTINIVQRLYLEKEYCQPLIKKISKDDSFVESSSISASKPIITNDLMADLYSNEESGSVNKESEIDCYIQKPIQRRKYDLLTWW